MPERAGILHSWAYIRQVQLGGQGSSEMVRHPSEQSSTFRSVTYDCLNVRIVHFRKEGEIFLATESVNSLRILAPQW